MNSSNVGTCLAQRLTEAGLRDFFCFPGDFNLVLLDLFLKNPGLRMIGCCNELNAGYAAEGNEGLRYHFQMQYGSIGWATGATLGMAQAAPSRPFTMTGYGSFQLTAQEISTMIRHEANPIIFLINNRGYTIEAETVASTPRLIVPPAPLGWAFP